MELEDYDLELYRGLNQPPGMTSTTLELPKISKPPDFNYVDFYVNVLRSDLRFGKLFPGSRPKDYKTALQVSRLQNRERATRNVYLKHGRSARKRPRKCQFSRRPAIQSFGETSKYLLKKIRSCSRRQAISRIGSTLSSTRTGMQQRLCRDSGTAKII